MSNHNDIRESSNDRQPRVGVLFKLGSNFESRHLREVAEQITDAYNTFPINYYGDYAGWVSQPGSDQLEKMPHMNAPDPTDSVWQDIESQLDQRLNILDTFVLEERVETHTIDFSGEPHIDVDGVRHTGPVAHLRRLDVGEVGFPSTPFPDMP